MLRMRKWKLPGHRRGKSLLTCSPGTGRPVTGWAILLNLPPASDTFSAGIPARLPGQVGTFPGV
jgi:hypothetical protein